jgi:hypothetical protein
MVEVDENMLGHLECKVLLASDISDQGGYVDEDHMDA